MFTGYKRTLTPEARIETLASGVRLWIPCGPGGVYRVAQLDDYAALPRRRFPHSGAVQLSLRCRASAEVIPGTWGFGLWNNPFSLALLRGPEPLRLPALPNAAWFFFAAAPNYLSLAQDLPAQGWLAGTFCSPRWPPPLLAPAALGLPLLLVPALARIARRLASRVVRQASTQLVLNPTEWHTYSIERQSCSVRFQVDGQTAMETAVAPLGPLGFVLWVDNQFFGFWPDGRIRAGTLANPQPAWVEVDEFKLDKE